MREQFGHALTVGAIGESLPNAQSFIDLDPDETDDTGNPLARIHSHLDERELGRLAFMARTAREILEASGVKERVEEYGTYDYFSSTHVFGTGRMGRDSEKSSWTRIVAAIAGATCSSSKPVCFRVREAVNPPR